MQLTDKVAVITGAASGIGRSMTLLFARAGARVVAADLSEDRLSELSEEAEGIIVVSADIATQAGVDRVLDTAVRTCARVDILCNNAGISDGYLPAAETPDEVWQRVLAVNLYGPFMACRAVIPTMQAQGGGVILNTSSIAGLGGGKGGAAYTSSKHALIGLTKNIAITYAGDGIRCVALCPGGIDTGIRASHEGSSSQRGVAAVERSRAATLQRFEPDDCADVALLLVSNEARAINGAVVVADGGWTAH